MNPEAPLLPGLWGRAANDADWRLMITYRESLFHTILTHPVTNGAGSLWHRLGPLVMATTRRTGRGAAVSAVSVKFSFVPQCDIQLVTDSVEDQ